MPPKRPRIVPSQTNISVQDVRDYTTPDGAAMANEEMRRLKMGLQQVQEEQAQAVANQQTANRPSLGTSAPPPQPPPALTEYKWIVKVENYREAEVNNGDTVTLRGIDGIRISQVGRRITIGQPRVSWILRADSGTHTVQYEGIVRIRGVNGVTTRAFPGNPLGTLEIDRPLRIYQRGNQIGDAATVGINFQNHSSYIAKNEHNQVHFHVQDMGTGVRRVTAWAKKGDVSSLEGSLSTVWIKDAATDIPLSVGYDINTGQYVNQLFVGPWGWQSGAGVTTPYAGSAVSDNARDTQWSYGTATRASALSAFTRYGKVDTAGLYLVSGTTQGIRYIISNFNNFAVTVRLHYHLMVRRLESGVPVTRLYKTLDVHEWDMWNIPLPTTDPENATSFRNLMSTLPWSLQGTAQIWLEAGDEIAHMISYSNGNAGVTRVLYQTTYHACEAVLIADATTLDPATQVNLQPVNYLEGPTNYHDMQFTNV